MSARPRPKKSRVQIWLNGVEMKPADRWRLDQAMVGRPGGPLFAAWTPHGIRQMESKFAERIIAARSRAALAVVRAELKKNPHLHRKIKDNLFLNIRRLARAMPRGSR